MLFWNHSWPVSCKQTIRWQHDSKAWTWNNNSKTQGVTILPSHHASTDTHRVDCKCCVGSISAAVNYMHDFDTSMNFTHFSCAAGRASWKGRHWRNEVVYYLLLSKAASKKLICGNVKTTENFILLISSSDVKIQWSLNLLLIIISIWIFKHSHIFMVKDRPLVIFNIQCTAWHNFCKQNSIFTVFIRIGAQPRISTHLE